MIVDYHPQYYRPWKQISYVTNRAYHEMYHDIGMLDTNKPEDAAHAAFKRVCCHIDYEHEKRKRPEGM